MVLLGQDSIYDLEPVIVYFLTQQPESWEGIRTLDGLLKDIRNGYLRVLLFSRKNFWVGMCLFLVREYEKNSRVMYLDFLSCNCFHYISKFQDQVEAVARAFGCDMIEAAAHPTIAAFAVNKRGYSAPAVFIRKELRRERKN